MLNTSGCPLLASLLYFINEVRFGEKLFVQTLDCFKGK